MIVLDSFLIVLLVYVFAAILPAIYFMRFINAQDKVEKEPANLLWSLIFGGVFAALCSMVLEQIGEGLVLSNLQLTSKTQVAIYTATMVGLIEEGTKYYFLKKKTWNNPNFDYMYDGIVYAVFVSLGFAGFENILYVFNFGIQIAPMRAILAIPAHMAFAVFMGSFYGNARKLYVEGNTVKAKVAMFLALISAIFFHAVYDSLCMIQTGSASMIFFVFVVIMYIVVYRKIKRESKKDRSIY